MPLTEAELAGEANPLLARMDGWGAQQQAQTSDANASSPKGPAAGKVSFGPSVATAPPLASPDSPSAISTPAPFDEAAPSLDPETAINSVRAAVEAEFGHLPDGVDIIHDPNAIDPQTGKPWAARIQNGRITLNAAHLTAQDAVANIEHEAIHDLYRRAIQGDPKLRRQWEALNKIIDQHPDLAQQVAEAGYDPSVRAEEISVRVAQRLAGPPAASAWTAFVESVRIALNQGLAAGKKNWTTRAAHRMAIRLLGKARANVEGNRFGKESDGEARYAYARPQGDQGNAQEDATAKVDPSERPNPLDPNKLAKFQDDLAQRLAAPKDPQIEQLLKEADAAVEDLVTGSRATQSRIQSTTYDEKIEIKGKHINKAYRLKAADGLETVFKPKEEQDKTKHRAGIAADKTCEREVAASEIAMAAGLTKVPPTGWVTHDGQSGSAQFFREGMVDGSEAIDLHNLEIDPKTRAPKHLPEAIAEEWQFMDDLLMHVDRHSGNCMVRLDERNEVVDVALIDNGHCLPAKPGVVAKRFPGPREGKPISPEYQARLRRLIENQPALERRLSALLEPGAVTGLFARAKALLARGTYGNFSLTEINAHLPPNQRLDQDTPFDDVNQ